MASNSIFVSIRSGVCCTFWGHLEQTRRTQVNWYQRRCDTFANFGKQTSKPTQTKQIADQSQFEKIDFKIPESWRRMKTNARREMVRTLREKCVHRNQLEMKQTTRSKEFSVWSTFLSVVMVKEGASPRVKPSWFWFFFFWSLDWIGVVCFLSE